MAGLSETLQFIRSTGLKDVLHILRYSLQRDWLDRKYRRARQNKQAPWYDPGQLQGTEATLNGAHFRFERAELLIDFLASDLARIAWEPGNPPVPYALAKTDWSTVQANLDKALGGLRLASQSLQIVVQPNGGLQFLDSEGSLLRQELPPRFQKLPDRLAWSVEAAVQDNEHFYGLGEQAGPLNLRGTRHRMWNTDPGGSYGSGRDPIYMPVPVYLGLHAEGSYLVFYENASPAIFDFTESCQISCEAGMLRYYFIPGAPDSALQRYTQLTGRAELPPRWSLGYHQSRWGYRSEADILSVVEGFREHELPLSAIHLDIDYMRGYRVFSVDPQRFPDLKAMVQRLEAEGIKTVVIIDPAVKKDRDDPVYQEGMQGGRFCALPNGKPLVGVVWAGNSVYPDFTDPKTRAWWSVLYRPLLDAGIAGIWHDMNEPTSFAAWGDAALPLATRHKLEGQGGDHSQAHNLYALLMNRAGYEGLRQLRPERRPWIVSRSGWASQQRYAWNWSGDSESTWKSLRMSIATTLGQGLCGLPYTGPDIGGFSGNPTPELYLRWFQLATFLPFFRTHSAATTARREPWSFGEPFTTIIRRFLRLRHQLMPYLYTLAWHTSQTGYPLVRPLFWSDPADQRLWDVDDAFLLGGSLLVAPILEEGQTQRSLELPAGRWYSLWDDTLFQGPGKIDLQASLETIPVLVRDSSLLPMIEGASEMHELALHLYPPETGLLPATQTLYSDSGDGYGEHRLERFQLQRDENSLEITWQGEGEYPFPYQGIALHLHGLVPRRAWIDEKPVELHMNRILTQIFQHVRIEV